MICFLSDYSEIQVGLSYNFMGVISDTAKGGHFVCLDCNISFSEHFANSPDTMNEI